MAFARMLNISAGLLHVHVIEVRVGDLCGEEPRAGAVRPGIVPGEALSRRRGFQNDLLWQLASEL